MADGISIEIGVQLNESDLNSIESKINSILSNRKNNNKIKFELDKSINSQISNLKSSIDSVTGKSQPYKINIELNQQVIKDIKSLTDELNKAAANLQKYGGKIGAASSGANSVAWNKAKFGFNTLYDYRNELDRQMKEYTSSLSTRGAKILSSSVMTTFEKDGTPNFKGIVEYENAVGKATKATMEFNNATKVWNVTSTSVSENYAKQAKEIERIQNILTTNNIKVSDLESKAFNQNNPLSGTFKAEAETAIQAWKNGIKEVEAAGNKVTAEQEAKLRLLEADAKRIVREQQFAEHGGSDLVPDDILTRVSSAYDKLDIQLEKLKQTGQYTQEIGTVFDGLKESLLRVEDTNGFNEWKDSLKQVNDELKLTQEQTKTIVRADNFKLDTRVMQQQLEGLRNKYEEIIKVNPDKANAEIEEQFRRVQEAINNMTPENISNVRKEMQLLRTEVSNTQPSMQSLSQILTSSFGGVGQYLARFTSATYVMQKLVSTTKKMVSEVKSIDTSLVELQKVTSLSGDALDQFADKAYNVGKGLGRTGQDVIDATTTFSRAGYDLQEATELAKSALVMTNVGVDIPNIDSAASDMISILKAFGKQADESMDVIDKLYNVANKEPLDFGNITQMLVTAGGTLAQTNTSLEETMGLLTGGFATLRDTSVANG